jgi:hypothetical protein
MPDWLPYLLFGLFVIGTLWWGMREIWNCVGVDEWDDGTKP